MSAGVRDSHSSHSYECGCDAIARESNVHAPAAIDRTSALSVASIERSDARRAFWRVAFCSEPYVQRPLSCSLYVMFSELYPHIAVQTELSSLNHSVHSRMFNVQ